jgi:altronate hydrolase
LAKFYFDSRHHIVCEFSKQAPLRHTLVLLFTTGRGTPLGFPVPTVKVSSNSEIAAKKPHWIDFNAGKAMEGTPIDDLRDELLERIIAIASGIQRTNNERNGYREIAIWKAGVTL